MVLLLLLLLLLWRLLLLVVMAHIAIWMHVLIQVVEMVMVIRVWSIRANARR
jgi:hypothetical protein